MIDTLISSIPIPSSLKHLCFQRRTSSSSNLRCESRRKGLLRSRSRRVGIQSKKWSLNSIGQRIQVIYFFWCSKYASLGTIMGGKIDKPSNAQETNPGSNCCMRENAFLCQARFHSPFISQCMLVCNVLVSPSWLSFLKPGKIEIICYQSESSCLCVSQPSSI